jgi:hypothetical protein
MLNKFGIFCVFRPPRCRRDPGEKAHLVPLFGFLLADGADNEQATDQVDRRLVVAWFWSAHYLCCEPGLFFF